MMSNIETRPVKNGTTVEYRAKCSRPCFVREDDQTVYVCEFYEVVPAWGIDEECCRLHDTC